MTGILQYFLSEAADEDLSDIYEYTIRKFGEGQAVRYLASLDDLFGAICIEPGIGRERQDTIAELRSISHGNHSVFYKIFSDHILIVRVLHSSRDISKFL